MLHENKPVVIDFYAEWCGSCKAVSKVIADLEGDLSSAIKFCELDLGKVNSFMSKYNITSLPTILLMKDGKEVARRNGMTTKADFKQLLQKIV
ncbi:thioredoxin fold domain-containing protein [Candidatus Pacearchaeota archaeon]|nr:thioredoxin fold domain-containing protein [Candidatus Pacearchaeota archaeon]